MNIDIRTLVLPALLGISIVALAVAIAMAPAPAEKEFVSRSGYTLRYPSNWIVVEGEQNGPLVSELIKEPHGRATISISVNREPRLSERGGRVAVANDIAVGFAQNETYRLDLFRWHDPDIGVENNGYIATGSFVYDSVNFDFKEIGILEANEKRTTFRTEVISAFVPQLGPLLDSALRSIDNRQTGVIPQEPISDVQALNRVRALPSIILYGAEDIEEGRDFTLDASDDDDAWLVRMFVLIGKGGRATKVPVQTWRVDKKTGIVSTTVL